MRCPQKGSHTGLPRFTSQTEWVRFFLSADSLVIRERRNPVSVFLTVVPFGQSLSAHLAPSDSRRLYESSHYINHTTHL